MNLIIVESPAKTKTIAKYLKGDYVVKASVGHIRDLPKNNKKAIDIAGGFTPHYEIIPGKEKVIAELKETAGKTKEILLATDPDREGEAIAWHIIEALSLGNSRFKIKNSKLPSIKRIVFNEITESAVKEALKHPRDIDVNLVKAQEARRVLDRLVGYDLSGLIWKKVRYGLSAGRVQSPALRILMEKEREIRAFKPENYWVITGEFETKNNDKIILICEEEPRDKKEMERIVETAKKNKWQIINATQTEAKRSPRPPFITSTLQQAASSRLGMAPSRTMSLAQKLYEQGFITYMRTDSVNISKEILPQIYGVIEKRFGKKYLAPRAYAAKSKTAQEAHEAIRPSRPDFIPQNLGGQAKITDKQQSSLYQLIWERTVASQMADAKISRTKISANIYDQHDISGYHDISDHHDVSNHHDISGHHNVSDHPNISGHPERSEGSQKDSSTASLHQNDNNKIPNFSTTGSIVIFDGWLAADPLSRGENVELPALKIGEPLKLLNISDEEKTTEPPPRYTEAGLIKELEKREIGRPSTYATIIKTLYDRGYTIKEGKALKPTDTGEVVSNFLEKNFSAYISDSFTAEMENELDEIAGGKRRYEKMLGDFYKPFSQAVKDKEKTAEKLTNLGEADKEHKCPVCEGPMVIKLSRSGKFLSCAKFPECQGARKIDGAAMEGPKETGEKCPQCKEGDLIEREGRFGKFIACSNYPKCKFIKTSAEEEAKKKTGVACPECQKGLSAEASAKTGEIMERRGRFGLFYSCSNYPKCKFIMKSRPTGNICKLCKALMMEGTKTIPERCSDKNCPNYNPSKQKN